MVYQSRLNWEVRDLAHGRAGRAHFEFHKVCPPMVKHTGLMPWVAIQAHAKPGYGSLAKWHYLSGPSCGYGINMAMAN